MRILLFASFVFLSVWGDAQDLDTAILPSNLPFKIEGDTLPDTVGKSLPTFIPASDTVLPVNSGVETTVNYKAKDSMFFDMKKRRVFLYGDTHIDYDDILLEASRTDVDWSSKQINADYIVDSAGKKIGKPIFTERGEVYVTDHIAYNFDTKKAFIRGAVTEQQGGFIHGLQIKKNEKNEVFIKDAKYTTCNLEHPHFYIHSQKIKIVPNKKVVSGPFNIKFGDLWTPIYFPFGMFPRSQKKSSGLIIPTYGEERRRGFFLRDGGYYFVINDYMDLRVTGDIYSKGSSGIKINSNYIKRYRFRGRFNISQVNSVSDEIENPLRTRDFWISWSHTPQTRGNSSISASVSAGTSTFSQNNNLVNQDFQRSIRAQFSSNISYSKKFQGTPFNLSARLRHSQNLQTKLVTMTLPDVTLNMNRIYPFAKWIKSTNSPLAKLSFSHNMSLKNELTNAVTSTPSYAIEGAKNSSMLEFNLNNLPQILQQSKFGVRHSIPVSTSVNLLKFFTLNPSFNYQEVWYSKYLKYRFDSVANGVDIDTLNGFSRAGSWTSGASLNTRIYGIVFFKKGKLQAIRHVMTPSLSFSYKPNFNTTKYGVYSDVQTDTSGRTQRLSKYQGFIYGAPSGGESKTIGFSLSNTFEMKVADKNDSVSGSKKVKLIDNLSLGTGYNLAADSFQLSNISLSARTSLFKRKLGINFSGTIDPYIRDPNTNARINQFALGKGQGLGQLTRANVAFNLQFQSKKRGKNTKEKNANQPLGRLEDPLNNTENDPTQYTEEEQEIIEHINQNPEQYIDFNIPWSFRASYAINRTKIGYNEASIRQSLSFSGSISLTQKTQLSINSGYDFQSKEFTTTRISASRDLHCWTLSFNWVPFGYQQSYFISIRAKSSILQDLKVEKRRNFFDFFE